MMTIEAELPPEPVPHVTPPRVEALREAARLIDSERNVVYGPPKENFAKIAALWSVILGIPITEEDYAMCMVAVKMARYSAKTGFQPDTWVDIAGYAGCGYEVGMPEQ